AWMHSALVALAVVVAALTLVVLIAAFHHERLGRMSARRRSPFADRLISLAARWSRDLDSLRRPSRFRIGLACGPATKTAEGLALVAIQHAFGLALPFSTTALVLAASVLGTIAPLAPANLGVYEGAVVAAYRYAGVGPELALAMAVVSHACLLLA